MKGLNNKMMSSLLAAAFLAQGTALAKIPADVEGTRFEEPIQVLAALDIMIGDENGDFRPDDTIIRSEVTKMAINAMGLEDAAVASSGQSKFPDVSTNHWANGYINLATDMGIVIGDDKGNFRPNDSITYAEAMTIMVRALGYERAASEKGGFPSGYMIIGNENGISKNVEGATHSPITRGNVAFLTANALETKMMEQISFGPTPEYGIVDKTLLTSRLGVTKHQGQITAIPGSAINGESNLNDGQVKIGDKVFETDYNVTNLLGFNVTYYIENEGKSTENLILALPVANANKTLRVTADLFEKVTEKDGKKVIEYFETATSKNTKTAELSKEAKLIYNGKYTETSDELIDLTGSAGNIKLLDTDKDGVYDIIFVTEYTNMVVDTVSSTGKITDKYNAPTIQLNEDVDYRIEKGLDEIKVSDLVEYDVLSIAASLDKKLYTIVVTNESVNGKVTGSDDEGYYINNSHYKVANNYPNELTIGTEGTFYLDIEGKIAAVDTTAQLSSNYAYMMKAYSTDEDTVKFRFFTKDGKEQIVEAAERIRLNGTGGKLAADVLKAIQNGDGEVPSQLVTYSVNSEGKLSALNIAKDNTATGAVNNSQFTLNYILKDAVFNAAQNKIGNIRVDDKTIIFNIPEGSKDSSEYTIANLDMFEDEQKYNVYVYDRAEDFTAKVILVTNANLNTSANAPIAVVKSIAEATNEDDEISLLLTILSEGKELKLFADSDDVLAKGEKQLEEGDIIQYKTNSNNEIVNVRVLMDISQKTVEKTESPAENLDTIYGKITKKFSSSINVTVNDGEVINLSIPKDVTVYSVDTTVSKNKVTVAEINDLQSYDEEEGNRVFVKLYKDVVEEIVIVK